MYATKNPVSADPKACFAPTGISLEESIGKEAAVWEPEIKRSPPAQAESCTGGDGGCCISAADLVQHFAVLGHGLSQILHNLHGKNLLLCVT